MIEVVWEEAMPNNDGIVTIAIEKNRFFEGHTQIVGYNDITKGDTVMYNGEEWTVVMVSRLGHIGLSKTGKLPYTQTAMPTELTKI